MRHDWPRRLEELGKIDLEQYRLLAYQRNAEHWRQNPPADPVLAIGFSGADKASAPLLKRIAMLPQGELVFVALDPSIDKKRAHLCADDPHDPCGAPCRFLIDHFDLAPCDLEWWRLAGASATNSTPESAIDSHKARRDKTDKARRDKTNKTRHDKTDKTRGDKIDQDKARPPPSLEAQLETLRSLTQILSSPFPPPTIEQQRHAIRLIACSDSEEEAVTIAALMRRSLDVPGKKTCLVTPDRELAQRVVQILKGLGIHIDDSAGSPLEHSVCGRFLSLLAKLAVDPEDAVTLFSLLKNPLAGGQSSQFRRRARTAELRWRKRNRLEPPLEPDPDSSWLDLEWRARLESLPKKNFTDWLHALLRLAEELATNEDGKGFLWRGDSGHELAKFCDELLRTLDQARDNPWLKQLPARECASLLQILMRARAVRHAWTSHPRLMILGVLEARLLSVDCVILGG